MMLKTSSLTEHQSAALETLEWFFSSGIQNKGTDSAYRGGVSAWYDLKTAEHSFLYSEITGYAVNFFLYFFSRTGDPRCLAAAREAGEWLIRTRDAEWGLVQNQVHFGTHEPYYKSWVFTFDQWIIIFGWCNLYEQTGEKKYLEAAQDNARFLLQKTLRTDGAMTPVFDLAEGKPVETGDKWSREAGSFHAKALMALDRLKTLTQDPVYEQATARLIEFVLDRQDASGRFITQQSNQSTHLHPHLYSVEGLLYQALRAQQEVLLSSCQRAFDWTMTLQRKNGSLPSYYELSGPIPFERVDVMAQALRAYAILNAGQNLRGDPGPKALLKALKFYTIKNGDHQGAFLYGQEQDGTIHYHLNAWVSMFAAQALWLYGGSKEEASVGLRFFV